MSAHAFSLASKMATLDVGDVIFLPDDAPPADRKPTRIERQVYDRASKSTLLAGRKFTTMRCDTITAAHVLVHTLRVERTV